MTRMLILSLLMICGTVSAQESAVSADLLPEYDPFAEALTAIDAGKYELATEHIEEIEDPVAKIYAQSDMIHAKGDVKAAMEEVCKALALDSSNQQSLGKCEILIVNLYIELGMLTEADNAARQIVLLYGDTEFENEANALRSKIATMKKATESK